MNHKSFVALMIVLFAGAAFASEATKPKTTEKAPAVKSESKSAKSSKQAVNKHGKKSKKMGF